MRGIIIKDCLNCPFSEIENPGDNGDILICKLGKNLNCEKEVLTTMAFGNYTIPVWCRLDDLQEVVDSAALEHFIMYRKETIRCPECGSTDCFQPKDVNEDGLFSILECKKCHSRWLSD